MLSKILLLQILIIIFSLKNSEAKLTIECIVDYLKFKNFDTEYFSSVSQYIGNPSDCTDEIKSKVESFYNDVQTKMNNHAARKIYAECVVQEVRGETQYENYRLAALGADIKGVGLKFWKSGDKNKYIQNNQNKAQEIEDNALIKCQGKKKYGEFFDSFYEQKKNEHVSHDFDHCLRYYISDNNIINSNQYGFHKDTPVAVSFQNVKCDEIMKATLDQMKAQISADGGQKCTIDKFIANGYLNDILKIQMLSKLFMTPAEKASEKEKFVSKMIFLTNLIKSCPL